VGTNGRVASMSCPSSAFWLSGFPQSSQERRQPAFGAPQCGQRRVALLMERDPNLDGKAGVSAPSICVVQEMGVDGEGIRDPEAFHDDVADRIDQR
jgi:hypothetical protein